MTCVVLADSRFAVDLQCCVYVCLFVLQLRKQAEEEMKSLRSQLTERRSQVRAMKQTGFLAAGDVSPRGQLPPRSPRETLALPSRS